MIQPAKGGHMTCVSAGADAQAVLRRPGETIGKVKASAAD